jgi:hypothetical protein
MSRDQVGPYFGGPTFLCSLYFLASFFYSVIATKKKTYGLSSPLLMREWTIVEV